MDNLCSLPSGVAVKLSQNDYSESKWRRFYESLCAVYDLENIFYNKSDLKNSNVLEDTEALITTPQLTINEADEDDDLESEIDFDMRASFIKKKGSQRKGSLLHYKQKLENKFSVVYLKSRIKAMKNNF